MRHGVILALLSALVLSACGTPPTEVPPTLAVLPTEEAPPPTTSGEIVPQDVEPTATQNPIAAEIETFIVATVPPAGTLVVPTMATAEPVSLMFDSLIFTQEGGPSSTLYRVELYSDGRLVKDGVTSSVSLEDVQRIDSLIDTLNFFNLEGQFTSAGVSSETYVYSLTVNRIDGNRTLYAQDGLTPRPLLELFSAIMDLGG